MQKSAYEMLISDWSSDVCSSDLSLDQAQRLLGVEPVHAHHARARQQGEAREKERPVMIERTGIEHHAAPRHPDQRGDPLQLLVVARRAVIDDQLEPAGR